MPLGASRLNGLARFVLVAEAEIIRTKKGISALGDAKVSTAQSKFGGASALFDGTGDSLNCSSPIVPASADFTVELWFRRAATGVRHDLIAQGYPGSNQGRFGLNVNSANTVTAFIGGTGSVAITSSSTTSADVWYHLAFVRSGNNFALYLDGTSVGTDTSSRAVRIVESTLVGNVINNNMNGHIDEVRISNIARYTANFTSSTTAFVNDANTLLLLHMDGTDASTFFEDDNGVRSKLDFRALGDAKISTAQSVFGGTSALFDGTGDYLLSGSTNDFGFGTGDFTLECRVRFTSTANNQAIISARQANAGVFANVLTLISQKLSWSNGSVFQSGATTLVTNTFYHVAASRQNGNLRLWVNGVSDLNVTDTVNVGTAARFIGIGAFENGENVLNGHIDEVRISNTARYTANFTSSTTAFVNDANTLLLLHMDGTNASTFFEDDNGAPGRSKLSIAPSSTTNPTISTTQSKFGGASVYFNNASGYLAIQQTPTMDLSGDFTFEAWIYTLTVDGNFRAVWDSRNSSGSVLADEILIDIQSGAWRVFVDGSDRSPSTLSANTWYHIALVRDGTNFKFYIDGTQSFTYNADSVKDYTMDYQWWIGNKKTQSTNYWYGYIDEIRFSNIPRYTAAFTPSTTSFQNDSNTLLLIHADGTNGSSTFTDDNGVPPDYEY